MRTEPNLRIESYRKRHPTLGTGPVGTNCGYFERGSLRILSSGTPADPDLPMWEHVSVSCPDRYPTWDDMAKVKAMFWGDNETVVQFHPRADRHVNLHPFCLHLWKRVGSEYELPPRHLIG